MARKIIRKEGILSGGSAGAILAGAMRSAKELKHGQNCVVLFPDSIRNYFSKFLNDEWMISNNFMKPFKPLEIIYPKNTFDTKAEYDPTAPPIYDYQQLTEPWPQKLFEYINFFKYKFCQINQILFFNLYKYNFFFNYLYYFN